MREKTKLRVIQILCIVSIIITVFSIQRTYARYYEKLGTTYATNIKRWVINLNTADIHGKSEELTKIMTPQLKTSEYINGDVLVPGSEGFFEFLIDYSKVDIEFKVDFIVQPIANFFEDCEIYGYSIIENRNRKNNKFRCTKQSSSS